MYAKHQAGITPVWSNLSIAPLSHDPAKRMINKTLSFCIDGLGSVNQLVDSTNQLSNNSLVEMLKQMTINPGLLVFRNRKRLDECKRHVESSGVLFRNDLFPRLSIRSNRRLPLF